MPTVDMQAWYETNKEALADLKRKFIEAMLEDEAFFDWGEGQEALYDHELDFKGAMEIAIKPVDDLMSELGNIDFALPRKPAEMSTDNIERYKVHVFDDQRLDAFESKLSGIFSNLSTPNAFVFGNYGSTAEGIQAAFYDYQYKRDLEDVEDSIDDLASAWAAEGYLAAPGAFGHEVAAKLNEFDRGRVGKTENVFSDLANVVQKNIQWSIENGVKIETLHMDFAIKYSELSKVFVQSAVDAYIAEIDKRLSEQKAQTLKIDALVKSMALDVKVDIAKNELELKERTERLNSFTQATNTYIDNGAGNIIEELRLAANISEGYGGIFSSYGSLFTGISYEE